MKKKLLLLIPAVAMVAACSPSEPPVPPEPEHPELDMFNELCDQIKNGHNYYVDVHSKIEGSSDDDAFNSNLINLNDKAIFSIENEMASGVIFQKDLGYVYFDSFESLVLPSTFYCSNPNLGIHDVYDVNIENIVKAQFSQDEQDKTKFSTNDATALLIAGQFTGYMDTAWIRTADVLNVSVDMAKRELVFTYEFQVGFIEGGEIISPKGLATFTVKNIGTTSYKSLEDYIEDPSCSFEAPTEWSDEAKDLFDSYYVGFKPSFIPGASLYFEVDAYQNYDGYHIFARDIGSGDLRNAYAAMLRSVDGFTAVDGEPYTYEKVVEDRYNLIKYTFKVVMTFDEINKEYNGHTIGYYYPKGVFSIDYSMDTEYLTISSVKEFNEYIDLKEHTGYVPYLMDEICVTKIGNFEDHTQSMIEKYGEGYRFYMTKPMRVYISNYEDAKDYAERYIDKLSAKGYSKQQQNPTDKMWQCSKEGFDSFIKVTDFGYVTEDMYTGYFEILFQLRVEEDEPIFDKIPLSLASGISHIVSYEFLDGSNRKITEFDKNDTAGMFFARFELEDGYEIESIIIEGDEKAKASFDEMNDRWEIKPSKLGVSTIVVKPVVKYNETLHSVSKTSGLEGGKIVLISGDLKDYAHYGDEFKFSCSADEGYEIESIFVVDHPEVEIYDASDILHPSTYAFVMPDYDVTLSASFKSIDIEKYSLSVDENIENGKIILSDDSLAEGEIASFIVKPSKGYQLKNISISGGIEPVLADDGSYSFEMPANDVVISATFELIPVEKYTISVSKGLENGTISLLSDSSLKAGETVSFRVVPDEGYELDELSITGDIEADLDDGIYSFKMPANDVEISATFKLIQVEKYTISVSKGLENGTISLLSDSSLEAGKTVSFEVVPDEGYELDELSITGDIEPELDDGVYSFPMPANDVEISATFKEIEPEPVYYSVDKDEIAGAKFVIEDDLDEAEEGETVSFKVELSAGFTLYSVSIKDHSEIQINESEDPVSGEITYSFVMPAFDVVITASVSAPVPGVKYEVSFDSFEHGEVVLLDEQTEYSEGDEVYLFALADDGYMIESVFEKDGSLEIVDLEDGYYSFVMPSHDVVIGATFVEEIVTYNVTAQGSTGGSVKNITPSSAEAGTTITFQVEPKENYSVTSVYIVGHDDVKVTNKSSNIYTFVMPAYDVVIGVSYKNNNPVQSVEDFNAYISAKGLSYFVPDLPEDYGENTITSFKDGTEDYNKMFGDTARFICKGSPVHVNFDTWIEAKDFASLYITALKNAGYTVEDKISMGGSSFVKLSKPDAEYSYIQIIDPDSITSSFGGTLDLIYYLIKSDDEEPIPATKYSISVDNKIENGLISNIKVEGVSATSAEAGDSVTFKVSADNGYELKENSVKVSDSKGNPVSVSLVGGSSDTYSFVMPESNVSIAASFVEVEPQPAHLISCTADHTSNTKFYMEDGETQITAFTSGDGFLIYTNIEAGYEFKSAALENDSSAQIYDWDDEGYYVIYVLPSKTLDEYNVTAVIEESAPTPIPTHEISLLGLHFNLDHFEDEGGDIITVFEYDPDSCGIFAYGTFESGYGFDSLTLDGDDDVLSSSWHDDLLKFDVIQILPSKELDTYSITVVAKEITPEPTYYSINKDTVEGITFKIGGMISEAEEGDIVRFTIDLDEGYTLSGLPFIKNHPEIDISTSVNPITSATTYSFEMPAYDVTISASVNAPAPTKYAINKDTVDGITFKIAGMISEAEEGDIVRFTIELDDDYSLIGTPFIVDHPEIDVSTSVNPFTSATTYSFEMPAHDVVISADVLAPAPEKAYHVQADSSIEHGSISFAASYYDDGETVEFTVTPDSGYIIKSVSIKNSLAVVNDEGGGKYSFTMPTSDVVVLAEFESEPAPEPVVHSVSAVPEADLVNGRVATLASYKEVLAGETAYVNVYPVDGCTVDTVYVVSHPEVMFTLVSGNKYSFTMPDFDVVVGATFAGTPTPKYTVSAATGLANGQVTTTEGYTLLKEGATGYINVIPEDGYEVVSVDVLGHEGDVVFTFSPDLWHKNQYKFTMPGYDVQVTATFRLIPAKYNVTVSESIEHGKITLDAGQYAEGDKVEFEVSANNGYEIDGVSSNPSLVITDEGDGIYSFIMPSEAVELSATFKASEEPTTSKVYSASVGSVTKFDLTMTINDADQNSGTGYYVIHNINKDISITQSFVWTKNADGSLSVATDPNVSLSTNSNCSTYHLLYHWSGDPTSDVNTITFDGSTLSFSGRAYNNTSGTVVTLTLEE